jgi:NAD(P)H-hydrate repair Nnr-like enzyme with NAD(P)H-hydrate dehydratase domain
MYVGAPMFAASAALACGADLSHIYCSSAASLSIKSQVRSQAASHCKTVTFQQSPELIVHPSWDENTVIDETSSAESRVISKWLPRNTALVIGSGLGRAAASLAAASHALAHGDPLCMNCMLRVFGLNFCSCALGAAGSSGCGCNWAHL